MTSEIGIKKNRHEALFKKTTTEIQSEAEYGQGVGKDLIVKRFSKLCFKIKL